MKTALITGITGQTGSYLAELLLSKGYQVNGIIRRSSVFNTQRIDHLMENPEIYNKSLFLHHGDLVDSSNLNNLINQIKPDEVYNLGAQSVHENSIIPILNKRKGGVCHIRIKDLWNNQIIGHKKPRVEYIDGVEVEVIDIKNNNGVPHALGYWNGMGTFFPIKQISRHKYNGKLADMRQKWGRILVTPNHSIYNSAARLCRPEENPELLCMRKLNYKNFKESQEFNFLDIIKDKRIIDIHDDFISLKNCSKKIRCKLSGDNLKYFMQFVGAYVSEGFVSNNNTNNSYIVGICNCDREWLVNIQNNLKDIFNVPSWITTHKKKNKKHKDCYQLEYSSKLLYIICKKMFGGGANTKKLFDGVFNYSNNLLREILDFAMFGDGNIVERIGKNTERYFTTSDMLAAQMCFLFDKLNINYTCSYSDVENHPEWKGKYTIRECSCYHKSRDSRDLRWVDYDGYVYDISVDEVNNFVIGTGNIVVHNSHVKVSFEVPEYTAEVDAVGTLRLIEAVKQHAPHARFYQASTSEMFGGIPDEMPEGGFTESSLFHPRSPYGVAKLYGYWITRNYREAYNLFATNGILFNHESIRRGETFVTRKITKWCASYIKDKNTKPLQLGNIYAYRDWGHAQDYAEAIWKIVQHSQPDDFVVATGETHTVKEFIIECFNYLGKNIRWEGEGIDEKGFVDDEVVVEISPKYFRPSEVEVLLGNPSKAKIELGWVPKYDFKSLVQDMMSKELNV